MLEESVKWLVYIGIMGAALCAVLTTFVAIVMGHKPGRLTGWCLIVLGLFAVLGLGRFQVRLAVLGERASGQISAVVRVKGGERPVVRFSDGRGTPTTFTGATVGRRGYYKPGQAILVRYMAANPQFAEVQSWWSLWQPILIGAVFAAVCMGGGVLLVRSGGRSTGRIPFRPPAGEALHDLYRAGNKRRMMRRLQQHLLLGGFLACIALLVVTNNPYAFQYSLVLVVVLLVGLLVQMRYRGM